YVAFGLVLLTQPASGALILTYLLGAFLLASGVIRCILSLAHWDQNGWDDADLRHLRRTRRRAHPVRIPGHQPLGPWIPAWRRPDLARRGVVALRASARAASRVTRRGEYSERSHPPRFSWPCSECRCRRSDRRHRGSFH